MFDLQILVGYWGDVLQNASNKEGALKQMPLFDYIRACLLFEAETDNEEDSTETSKTPQEPKKQSKITDHFACST